MQKGKVDAVASILRSSQSKKILSIKELENKLDLPNNVIKGYLATMISKNLVQYVNKGDDRFIRITNRGIKFLELYDAIKVKYLTNEPSKN